MASKATACRHLRLTNEQSRMLHQLVVTDVPPASEIGTANAASISSVLASCTRHDQPDLVLPPRHAVRQRQVRARSRRPGPAAEPVRAASLTASIDPDLSPYTVPVLIAWDAAGLSKRTGPSLPLHVSH